MRVVFMGTPAFALPSLRALVGAHRVVHVYTQPDRPSGRGRDAVAPPVKQEARALGLPVRQPLALRDPEEHAFLRSLDPDVVCVAAYGLILPPQVLEIPHHGCVNVHASLLPRYRGAAPVHRTILEGDEISGVSIMLMEEGLDTGPYALQVSVPLNDLNVDSATALLADAGAGALLEVLGQIEDGSVRWTPQDEGAATYAEKITKSDVELLPELTVEQALRRVRASSRSASSRACVDGTILTVLRASQAGSGPEPGEVVTDRDTLVLGFSDGGLALEEVLPQGRACMDGACFARGARLTSDSGWEPCP